MNEDNCDGFIDPSKSNGGIPRGKMYGFAGPCEGKTKIPTPAEVQKSILASCDHTTKLVDDVRKKGFTLIELLTVIAIVCIIGSVIIEAIKHKGIL